MELLNPNNILDDDKEEIIISDTHGDFTSILNVLNNYLNTNLKFKLNNNLIYNDCIKQIDIDNINNYISINSSIIKHYDIIMNENNIFKFIKNDKLRNLNNKRLILLGDVYDPYNFRSLRIMIEQLIKEEKYIRNDKLLLDDDGKNMINNENIYKYGNIMLSSSNKLVVINMIMTYKLLLCLEKYLEVKYIVGNHEISSFDEYPLCIKNKILNDFKCYYYNKKRNILYCHFHIDSKIPFKYNQYTYNLKNIDDIFKDECNKYINNQNNKYKLLNSIIIHCIDNKITTSTEYSNKTYKLGNPHYITMKSQSIFQKFINKENPIIICGHCKFKDACSNTKINNEWDLNIYHNYNIDRLIYYIDCDISIFHSNNFINNKTKKKGIILNCQYINNINKFSPLNNVLNIKYNKVLNDYLYYIDNDNELINKELYDEKDYNKLLIFNTFDKNNIKQESFNSILSLKNKMIIDF